MLRRSLVAFVLVAVTLLAGCGSDVDNNAALEHKITHACDPMKNVGVDYHGPSWEETDRYEVTCSDGSQRIVYP